MKLGVIPENLIEWIIKAANLAPTPLMDTMAGMMLARTIMVGTKLNVFEALTESALTVDETAARCKTNPDATKKLLTVLANCGYLRVNGEKYALTPISRKWLLKEGPYSLYDNTMFRFMEWDWIMQYEKFICEGKPLIVHETFTEEEWGLYQRGMRSLANMSAPEVVKRTTVPKGASDMLDIGGSHGYYSVSLCRRHQNLSAVILDLPDAVEKAAPILAKENMGNRVVHRAGDALTEDLGTEAWDLVFTAHLVHHFDDATNREFTRRVARALRPGGVFTIMEPVRPASPEKAGQIGALLDLYFALTSEAGTWSYDEMADWQREAGLEPLKPIKFRMTPGVGQQAAVKPSA